MSYFMSTGDDASKEPTGPIAKPPSMSDPSKEPTGPIAKPPSQPSEPSDSRRQKGLKCRAEAREAGESTLWCNLRYPTTTTLLLAGGAAFALLMLKKR